MKYSTLFILTNIPVFRNDYMGFMEKDLHQFLTEVFHYLIELKLC